MKTLLIGTGGQIGYELQRAWPAAHQLVGIDFPEINLADAHSIQAILRAVKPELIINAAAYTAVDRAEDEPDLARALNATALEIIGVEAHQLGAAVVHYSTDYVFDGASKTPYRPTDSPNPQSVYGRTKLDGELALAGSGAAHLILRTSWIYGLRGRNFVLAILKQALTKEELKIVADQFGSPTWCRTVAEATIKISLGSAVGEAGSRTFGDRGGVYHLTCGGMTNWFNFAERIFDVAPCAKRPRLIPTTTAEYKAKAPRPAFSMLDCSLTASTFGIEIVDWDVALQSAFRGQEAAALAEALSS